MFLQFVTISRCHYFIVRNFGEKKISRFCGFFAKSRN